MFWPSGPNFTLPLSDMTEGNSSVWIILRTFSVSGPPAFSIAWARTISMTASWMESLSKG